jgi:hypothetical protein
MILDIWKLVMEESQLIFHEVKVMGMLVVVEKIIDMYLV